MTSSVVDSGPRRCSIDPSSNTSSTSSGSSKDSARNSSTRSQILQLLTCQHCRKKRRRRKGAGGRSEREAICSETTQVPTNSSNHQLSVVELHEHTRKNNSEDEDITDIGRKGKRSNKNTPRTKLMKFAVNAQTRTSLASILKNRHSLSPNRNDISPTFFNRNNDEATGGYSQHRGYPIRLWETDAGVSSKHEPSNSILARTAKLKNASGYGSFSFQRDELQQFNAAVEASSGEQHESNSRPKSASDSSSSGSGSPFIRPAAKSGKRARFNEAVDIIVDDRRSGRPVVKNSVKLKPSADVFMFDSDVTDDRFRKRMQSDCDSAYSAVVSRLRRRRRAFGEARMTIIHSPASGARGTSHSGSTSREVDTRVAHDVPLLQVVISLDDEFARDKVFVRTALGGTRLLVGAYKPEPLGDGTNYLRQFVDRYNLPHAIDVLTVTATLGTNEYPDDLVITAQLFDFENDSDDNIDASDFDSNMQLPV